MSYFLEPKSVEQGSTQLGGSKMGKSHAIIGAKSFHYGVRNGQEGKLRCAATQLYPTLMGPIITRKSLCFRQRKTPQHLCWGVILNGCLAMSYFLEPKSVEQGSTQLGESKMGKPQTIIGAKSFHY